MLAKQIKFVLLTIIYRPWTWVILGFSVFMAVMMFGSFSIDRNANELVRPVVAPYSDAVQDPARLSALGSQVPVKVQLASLIHASRRSERTQDVAEDQVGPVLDQLSTQHRVVALSFQYLEAGPEGLARMKEFPQLEALDLGAAWSEGVPDLGVLAGLAGLRRLDLNGAVGAQGSLAPLKSLPVLEELALNRADALTPEHLDDIAALPNLKVLYLPSLTGQTEVLRRLARLEASASLKTVYLPLKDPRSPDLYAVRERLKNLAVRRGFVGPPAVTLFGPVFPIVFLLIGLTWQIAGWFSGVDAFLRPGYLRPHRTVTWAILGALLLLVGGFVMWSGRPLVPMLSFGALAVVCMARSNLWGGVRRSGLRSAIEAGVLLLFLAFLVAIMSPAVGLWVNAFLWDDFPWLNGIFAVTAIALAIDLDVRLQTMARDRVANHRPALMTAEDLKADAEAMQFVAADAPPTGWWPRPPRPKRGWARFIPLLVIGFLLWPSVKHFLYQPAGASQMVRSLAVGTAAPLFFVIFSLFSQRWWQRFPLLATLMTRPPSRRVHTGRFFRAVAWDFLKLWPLPVLAVGLGFAGRSGLGGDWAAASVVYGLGAVGLIGLVYATTLWMLPVRTQMLFALGSLGPVLVVWMVLMATLGLNNPISLPVIGGATGVVFVLAAGIFVLARRRFELEWGKY